MTWLFCLTLYPISCYTSVTCVCVLVTFPLHAVNRSDYNPLREKVVELRACETMVCESIGILNDRTAEKIESFTVTLGRTPSLDSRISLVDVEGLVIINDDDGNKVNESQYYFYLHNNVCYHNPQRLWWACREVYTGFERMLEWYKCVS